MLLWVNNFLSKFEGGKRDVPNIADYSIWYLQLPLKKKREEEKEENIQPIQNELHVHSTIIQTWLQSKNAGASLIVMTSSAALATSRGNPPIGGVLFKKKKKSSSPGSWFQLLCNDHKHIRVGTRQAWQQFISEEKITEELAPPVRPIPKVIPGLDHRLSVLMLGLWYVAQLHYLYRALPFGCTDEAWNN